MILQFVTLGLFCFSAFLFSAYLFRGKSFLENAGYVLFSFLTAIAVVNMPLLFWAGVLTSHTILFIESLAVCVIMLVYGIKRDRLSALKNIFLQSPRGVDYAYIFCLIGLSFFFALYYSNLQFYLSLGSFLLKGEAECFYMQTFKTMSIFHASAVDTTAISQANTIICTPGNTLFTSVFTTLLKTEGFRVLYVCMHLIIFIFSVQLIQIFIKRPWVALIVGICAVCNPYMLSVEVLDRNVITFALSLVYVVVLLRMPQRIVLHAIIFALLSGTGLRFMPLIFIFITLSWYYRNKQSIRAYLLFALISGAIFSFNIPHIFQHGFHSLGEDQSVWVLSKIMLFRLLRTPFMPFPNSMFYCINMMNYWGYAMSIIVLLGLCYSWTKNRFWAINMIVLFCIYIFVLGIQRNWIEGDKYRIIIEAFIIGVFFLGYGIDALLNIPRRKLLGMVLVVAIVPYISSVAFAGIRFESDESFYKRQPLYQRETRIYYDLMRKSLLDIPFFPNFKRLLLKNDLAYKNAVTEQAKRTFFMGGKRVAEDTYSAFYKTWDAYLAADRQDVKEPQEWIDVCIDLTDLEKIKSKQSSEENTTLFSIDLSQPESLFDTYYAEENVSIQDKDLTMTVFIDRADILERGVLYIDLNAFESIGKDELGLDKIVPISRFALEQHAVESFPLFIKDKKVFLRLPRGMKIVLRNWFIDQSDATPKKIDGWSLEANSYDDLYMEFYYNEPESYL